MVSPGLQVLAWIFFVHLAGIYLFSSGFLLTRLALTNVSSGDTLAPTHKKALIIIIDSLRFDFIAPGPFPDYSPYHHSILTLPSLLTASQPEHSFIFNSYPDPPTTTLQRIKGLTTGSLPTFVDAGSNFGGSEIEEDTWIGQVGGEVVFMGDDTWMSVFPNAFNKSWPYDSFNVEDLHTVDNGVITHLFPLLESGQIPDVTIAHSLGVDHVGHRVGPYHPSMHAKLTQMNTTLARVVDLLPNDTLLVVLGDHGMDRAGDHGGDGELETSAAMWFYSKSVPLTDSTIGSIPPVLRPNSTFPNTHRHIQQIDLVPTLSLLLGLPIPFNNLGTVIPELFWRSPESESESESWRWTRAKPKTEPLLSRALSLNAQQIHTYLHTYRNSSSGSELDDAWSSLSSTWDTASTSDNFTDLWTYTRLALSSCRSMWAQFNPLLMTLGLLSLSSSLLSTWAIYTGLCRQGSKWEEWLQARLWQAVRGFAGGATLGFLGSQIFENQLGDVDSLDCILFMAPFVSCVMIGVYSLPQKKLLPSFSTLLSSLPFILHALAFFSNSFTFWEDRLISYLLPSSLLPFILMGFRAPTARLRRRILAFVGVMLVCVRLMGEVSVCREEQHPYCHVTFYSTITSSSSSYTSAVVPPSASSASAPMFALILAPSLSILLPQILRWFLKQSKSDRGLASIWFEWVVTPSLVAGSAGWILEGAETNMVFDEDWSVSLRLCRTILAWFASAWPLVVGGVVWWRYPMCIDIEYVSTPSEGQPPRQIHILGYANALGAPFLLFTTILLCLVWASSQLAAQVVLALGVVAMMCWIEIVDGVGEVKEVESAFKENRLSDLVQLGSGSAGGEGLPLKETSRLTIPFAHLTPLVLLSFHTFFRTGHQSTAPSLQWKSAFLLTSTLTYPWSVVGVVLNTVGPMWVVLVGGVGLGSVWCRGAGSVASSSSTSSPNTKKGSKDELSSESKHKIAPSSSHTLPTPLLTSLLISLYIISLLLTTSLSAALLRRHLMVWKVFAPRWIMAVFCMLVGDVAVLVVYVGAERVRGRVGGVLRKVGVGA